MGPAVLQLVQRQIQVLQGQQVLEAGGQPWPFLVGLVDGTDGAGVA